MAQCRNFNSFKLVCWLGTALFLLLFALLVTDPNSFMEGACVAGGEMVYFFSRRVAVFMFSFALVLFLFRNAPLSSERRNLFVVMALCMVGFASTGVHEFVKGGIGASVFVSVSIELVYATLFAVQAVVDSRKLKNA
jgi:heme A synthase